MCLGKPARKAQRISLRNETLGQSQFGLPGILIRFVRVLNRQLLLIVRDLLLCQGLDARLVRDVPLFQGLDPPPLRADQPEGRSRNPSQQRPAAPELAATTGPLFRRRNLLRRYPADGGRASTGSSARYRWMSRPDALAVS